MKYKIIDLQGGGLMADDIFETKQEIIDRLASFHSVDYEGQKFDGTFYKDIYEFLDTLKGCYSQLNWLLDYGQWEIEEIIN